MADHSPGPWTHGTDDKDDCILDANSHHIICFGHDYDQYGGFSARLPRQKNQTKKEIAVIEANIELVRSAPEMLGAILKLRDALLLIRDGSYDITDTSLWPDGKHPREVAEEVLPDTEQYERYRNK